MTLTADAKATAQKWVADHTQWISDFHVEIWNYAEPGWREYKSAAAFCKLLRDHGFEVEEGSGGMPTAFAATWRNGPGPVVGGYAEYDAVPGNSQQVVPYKAPRAGLHPWAAGHTDPHSALGVGAVAGILAAKAAMEAHGIGGTLKFFGEPAEKMCGSKPVHAAKGYFDGCDAFISYHPLAANTTVWETHSGSYWSVVFTFETPAPETWIDKNLLPIKSSQQAVARCPGALDAVCMMYTLSKYTRDGMFPHAGGWTCNEFILSAGDATSDNLPPRFSQIQYSWRSPRLEIQEHILKVLCNNARSVAQATGTKASLRWVAKTRIGLANNAMARITWDNLKAVGAPELGEEAKEFARDIQRNLGFAPMEQPFMDRVLELQDPHDYEAWFRSSLPEWQKNMGSDDYVEYTWHAPTVRLFTQRPKMKPPAESYEYPAWVYNALGGLPAANDPGMVVAAKTISMTYLDLLTRPELLEEAQAEFRARTGGGVGGTEWVAPLLPKDFVPPVDLRWPEYVSTVRGEEWCIPTPFEGSGAGEPL